MKSQLIVRSSDSPLIHSVSFWTIGDEATILACPDGLWDLVVYKKDQKSIILVTGQTTQAVALPFTPGDEILTISFKPGSYFPFLPGDKLLDRAEVLKTSGKRFELDFDTIEIPQFDNAEDLVRQLQKKEALKSDELVSSFFTERPLAASVRSIQRHFQYATGLSPREFFLIERARRAMDLLKGGLAASEVALVAGYSDQAHLSRSLKSIMGQTPTQIQAAG